MLYSGMYTLLLFINKIFLLALVYLVFSFLYRTIKFLEIFNFLGKQFFYMHQILPLVIFPLAFVYLIACLYYLSNYLEKETIGLFPSIIGYTYAAYLIYALGKTFFCTLET